MRELNIGTKRHTVICAVDEPGPGGACHVYEINSTEGSGKNKGYVQTCQRIMFQKDPVKEHGVNGIHSEDLLVIVLDRLFGFQAGRFNCSENSKAIIAIREAMCCLNDRTKRRESEGVEGTSRLDCKEPINEISIADQDKTKPSLEPKKHEVTKPHDSASPAPALRNSNPRYRKKPLEVEAVQWFPGIAIEGVKHVDGEGASPSLGTFYTIHGQETFINPGDWVIREPDGIHWYPCKPDIFEATYDIVLDERN